jgi:hypothetical protein
MTGNSNRPGGSGPALTREADLRRLSAHPYLVSVADVAADVEPLTAPIDTGEVLDLTFGAADALVELHGAGHTHGAIGPDSLVVLGSGQHRLVAPPVKPVPGASQAGDLAELAKAARDLLPSDRTAGRGGLDTDEARDANDADGVRLAAGRQVLDSAAAGDYADAVAFRDAVAAVRLGPISAGPLPTSTTSSVDRSPQAAGTTSSGSGDRSGLRDLSTPADRSDVDSPPARYSAPGGLLLVLVVVAVVLAVAIALMLTVAPF